MTPAELIRELTPAPGSQPARARAPRRHEPERDRADRGRRRGGHLGAPAVDPAAMGDEPVLGSSAVPAATTPRRPDERARRCRPRRVWRTGVAFNKFGIGTRARGAEARAKNAGCLTRLRSRTRSSVSSPSIGVDFVVVGGRGGAGARIHPSDAGSRRHRPARPRSISVGWARRSLTWGAELRTARHVRRLDRSAVSFEARLAGSGAHAGRAA